MIVFQRLHLELCQQLPAVMIQHLCGQSQQKVVFSLSAEATEASL